MGTRGAIASEHYLSAQVGADIMKAGGNAVDGAVAATLMESLVNPQMFTLGGECPILIRPAGTQDVVCINGNTAAPGRATPQAFLDRGLNDLPPEGILAAGVPAAFGALVTALQHHGTMPFAQVSAPAIAYARGGFPAHKGLIMQPRYGLRDMAPKMRGEWASSAEIYLLGGEAPQVGHVLKNPAYADFLEAMGRAESAAGGGRAAALRAVYAAFYSGDVASEIAAFSKAADGLLERTDMEAFQTHLETPASIDFHGHTVFKCPPWNQGPVMLQTLRILAGHDLRAMGHNSAEYLHTVVEAVKLAYADREQYYGDPNQVDVPLEGLLSERYGNTRAALIDPARANGILRPGDPATGGALLADEKILAGRPWGHGTVHVCAIDAEGNMAAFTPSGGWLRSQPVVPALGFPLSNRMQTFYLGPEHHPNLVAPFRRPRTTISPSLAFKDGAPWTVFGSMGGDQQDQWMLQYFLNRAVFDMPLQAAIEAPKFSSEHFPGFFAPHDHQPNRLRIEATVPEAVRSELETRGHVLDIAGAWSEGYLLACERNPATGVLEAGCDPRAEKSEVFPSWALAW